MGSGTCVFFAWVGMGFRGMYSSTCRGVLAEQSREIERGGKEGG